jgi:hypothetical protein
MSGQSNIYQEITTQLLNQIEKECSVCYMDENASGNLSAFVKGLLLGQLSVLIVIAIVLRYMFLEDASQNKKVGSIHDSLYIYLFSLCLLLSNYLVYHPQPKARQV